MLLPYAMQEILFALEHMSLTLEKVKVNFMFVVCLNDTFCNFTMIIFTLLHYNILVNLSCVWIETVMLRFCLYLYVTSSEKRNMLSKLMKD